MELVLLPFIMLLLLVLINNRAKRDPLNYDRFEDPSNPKEK